MPQYRLYVFYVRLPLYVLYPNFLQDENSAKVIGKLVRTSTVVILSALRQSKAVPWSEGRQEGSKESEGL
jgi:hypothetical protein